MSEATLKVASDIFDSADAGQVTLLALLDLSAAFDTVDHHILLQRLYYTYGIGGIQCLSGCARSSLVALKW